MASLSYKLVISGLVQGVSFRASMKDVALRNDVAGWVRNRGDGGVEALVQGEEKAVESVIEWARSGPPGAKVISVDKRRLDDCPPHSGFHVLL